MTEKLGSSAHGIDITIAGLLNTQTGDVVTGDAGLTTQGPYAVDAGVEGATQAEFQTLEAAGTAQYANNKLKRRTHPAQNPTGQITYLDIDWTVLNKMVGYEEDETGGAVLGEEKPHFAVLTRAPLFDGNYLYEAFANSTATYQTSNHQSDTTDEQDANVQLNLTGYEPIGDVFKTKKGKKMPYKRWNSGSSKFDEAKMLQEVFPGIEAKTVAEILKYSTAETSNAPSDVTLPNTQGTGVDTTSKSDTQA